MAILCMLGHHSWQEYKQQFRCDKCGKERKNPRYEIFDAIKEGDTARLLLLLDKGAEVNLRGVDDMTPLHIAVKKGHFDISRALLEKGSNINAEGSSHCLPIYLAIEYGHKEVVWLLLEKGAKLSSFDRTALHCAVRYGHIDIVRVLLDRSAPLLWLIADSGYTPLHLAALSRRLDILTLLLEAGAYVNMKAHSNNTALLPACSLGYVEVVKKLLEAGADAIEASDEYCAPLITSKRGGFTEIEKLLLDAGAGVTEVGVKRFPKRACINFIIRQSRETGREFKKTAREIKERYSSRLVPNSFEWSRVGSEYNPFPSYSFRMTIGCLDEANAEEEFRDIVMYLNHVRWEADLNASHVYLSDYE
jgi:hypothetical protein